MKQFKKHLMVGIPGLGIIAHLCGQHFILFENDRYGDHLTYYSKNVTCKRCLAIREAIRKGRKPPYNLEAEMILNR